MSTNNNYDVIVMGGGPAGSSVASMLAREGRQVILFEKEVFPRHHIGESLMTDTYWTFRRMGLLERGAGTIHLTRRGLLQVDHFLLDFFEPELRTVRYA